MNQEQPSNSTGVDRRPGSDSSYALRRAIFINSLTPGYINEISLMGHTCLTGINGAGKTTYLKVIPLFYGAAARDIVLASHNNQKFTHYYLPHQNSYIVFEYQRPGEELRCVIINADKDGENIQHRLVRQGFDPRMFTRNGTEVVAAADLLSHMLESGFEKPISVPSVEAYKQIIQGNKGGSVGQTRSTAHLIHDFSCADPKTPLYGIERVVLSMFKRHVDFRDLKNLVVDSLRSTQAGNGVNSVRLDVREDRLPVWPMNFRAYQDSMAVAGVWGKAVDHLTTIGQCDRALAGIKGQLQCLALHRREQAKVATARQRDSEGIHAREATTFANQASDINESLVTARGDRGGVATSLQQLRDQADNFSKQGVKEAAEEAERGDDYAAALETREDHKKALLGEHASIAKQFDDLEQKLDSDLARATSALNASKARCAIDLNTKQQELDEAERLEKAQLGASHAPEIAHQERLVEEIAGRAGRAEQSLLSPSINAELIKTATRLRDEWIAALGAVKQSTTDSRLADEAYSAAINLFHTAERSRDLAIDSLKAAEKRLAEESSANLPKEGSLLKFLDDNVPDWAGSIGKVINKGLLGDTRLSPYFEPDEVSHGGGSLYGLHLNLAGITPCVAADREAAAAAIRECERQVEACKESLDSARVEMEKASLNKTKAEKRANEARAAVVMAEARANSGEETFNEAERRVGEAKEKAIEEAKEVLQTVADQLEAAKSRLVDLRERFRQAVGSVEGAYAKQRREVQELATTEQKRLDGEIDRLESEAKVQRLAIKKDRAQALTDAGVDRDVVEGLDKEILDFRAKLEAIKTKSELVGRWRTWLPTYMRDLPELETKERKLGERVSILEQQAKDLKEAWGKRSKKLCDEATEYERAAIKAEEEAKQAEAYDVQVVTVARVPVQSEFDPVWSCDLLVSQARPLVKNREQAGQDLESAIREIRKAFSRYAGSGPAEFVLNHEKENTTATPKDWVEHFGRWFLGQGNDVAQHEVFKNLLLTDAQNIGMQISRFHGDLLNFHNEILQFNREISSTLMKNTRFASLNRVEFKVKSTVTELKYWTVIQEAKASFEAWNDRATSGRELPDADFVEKLERLRKQPELNGGLSADLRDLIQIEGAIEDKGERRTYTADRHLTDISSNGLTYLVLVSIFLGFINRLRKTSSVYVTWTMDELTSLDAKNIRDLLDLLTDNMVTLLSAFPDPKPESLALFTKAYTIPADRRPNETRVAPSPTDDAITDLVAEGVEEEENV